MQVHAIGRGRTKYSYTPGLIPWLRSNARRFDAVVVHGVWHYHTVGTWLALRSSGVPYFVILHGMLHPWFKKAHPLKHLKKAIFWHTLVHPALQNASAVLFLCEEESRLAPRTFRMKLRGSAIAPLGIETAPRTGSIESFFLKYPRLKGKRLLLFLGRICRLKSCDLLLKAFSEACASEPDVHLVMSGPDFEGWQGELTQLAKQLGMDHRVTWTGPLYGDEKIEAMRAAELFVLPSHCETFPVAVLEALRCATPVLISDQVGIYREVRDGRAGLICQDNHSSLVEGLRTWLQLDESSRVAFRTAARQCFVQNFEIAAATARQLEVIRHFSTLASSDLPVGRETSIAK